MRDRNAEGVGCPLLRSPAGLQNGCCHNKTVKLTKYLNDRRRQKAVIQI